MKRLSLALGALALAIACAQSAKADTFSFSFTGFDFEGSGTFTATETGNKVGNSFVYDITDVSGSVTQLFLGFIPTSTSEIASLLPANSFDGNDNKLFDPGVLGFYNFDEGGVSFLLANGVEVNLGVSGLLNVADESKGKSETAELANFDIEKISASPVPEPGTLALLGTGILGAAGAIRRRLMA